METRSNRWNWPWWLGALVLVAAAFYAAHLAVLRSPRPSPVPAPYSQIRKGMISGTYAITVFYGATNNVLFQDTGTFSGQRINA